jgi:hypothetical protein
MSELEESSALVGDYLRGITQPDALAGSFRQMGAGGSPIKGGGEILDIIKVPPKPGFCAVLATRHGVTDENTFSHHSA